MQKSPQAIDFALKETSPKIGAGSITGDKLSCTYDLVEQMQYLYVRVVKAKDLPGKDVTGSCDPYVEVKLGNYKGTTKHFEKKSNPEWNQCFAFSKDRIQASVLEVLVKDKDVVLDDLIGRVMFDLNEVPKRIPPDSPLAPQWYRLEDRKGDKVKTGELMLAVWMGTQADEAFPDAWHSDAATVSGEGVANIRSKVYLSPKLWYVRVNIIEAQDLLPSDKSRFPEVFVKAILGNQASRTRISPSKTINPMWNEDLMFVAAEPFEEPLILTVEDRVAPNKDEVLGKCLIPLQAVQRRLDHKPVNTRICLDGGYHVLDESTHYSSDLRPTAKQLWKPSIGILELGVLSAHGLTPMKTKDGRGTTDAYCVAKYGQKWVRTRTIVDSFGPRWNEQYTWEVFDPCTVITVGVFDNGHIHGQGGGGKDSRIGKIVSIRLNRAEPPLRKEVVEYMLDVDSHMWSMRRSKANFFRIMGVLSSLISVGKWFDQICNWKNPLTTILIHILFIILVLYPELILPTVFLYLFLIGIWNFRWRPRHPPHMDTRLSHAEAAHPDELDEEFDTFPTTKGSDIVRMRYDRLRSIAGRVQTVIGDLATQGERFQSLISWRDPRATTLFVTFCLIAAIVLYVTPFQVVALLAGIYVLRHPRFRHKLPSVPLNFFRRLPARSDSML
ncbi:Anthranilate phosphoribosyltransferase-like protein [Citrus sinensis]|uniref:Anthranilate phosphoribosyltransferase-like protein n=1 Tax=Citrus sinensis TaxID=2711 RepID=A0ACB8MUN6_CITSI|nr:Anthranilate phosphoribosyltransferase-like protein [Citrus sinensis]KAH9789526.1 Anthranilate phosphoribosyltransferase-like protein [Citrus sinensis]